MKKCWCLIVLMLVARVSSASVGLANTPEQAYQEGLTLYDAGRTAEAVDVWSTVLQTKPASEATQAKAIIALAAMVKNLTAKVQSLEARLVGSGTTGGIAPAHSTDVIRAKAFELVDSTGKLRGTFALRKDEACLDLLDSEGKRRGEFSMVGGEPSLALVNSAGRIRAAFLMVNGEPSLSLVNSAGKPGGWFRMLNGEPGLSLHDAAGKLRGAFTMINGEPNLGLLDSAEKPRGYFGMLDGQPRLGLIDSAGKTVWSAP